MMVFSIIDVAMIKAFFIALCLLIPTGAMSAETVQPTPNTVQQSHIRVLAASCAACHGTQGNSVGITPSLAGLDAGYFVTQMLAFKQGERSSTVMHHHAKGLNVDEINALATYFSEQKRHTSIFPIPQQLKDTHGR
jgi:cytochrome c553